jgi:hypothetical protein
MSREDICLRNDKTYKQVSISRICVMRILFSIKLRSM